MNTSLLQGILKTWLFTTFCVIKIDFSGGYGVVVLLNISFTEVKGFQLGRMSMVDEDKISRI